MSFNSFVISALDDDDDSSDDDGSDDDGSDGGSDDGSNGDTFSFQQATAVAYMS